jgi:hypothetical protein
VTCVPIPAVLDSSVARAAIEYARKQAMKSPEAAPRFSMPADLLREWPLGEITSLEREAQTSRWGP